MFGVRVVQYFAESEFATGWLIIKIFGFAILGLADLKSLRIFDSGISLRICGFAICGP